MLGQSGTTAELKGRKGICWCPSEAPGEGGASPASGAAVGVWNYHGQHPPHSQVLSQFVTEPPFSMWLIFVCMNTSGSSTALRGFGFLSLSKAGTLLQGGVTTGNSSVS